MYQKIKNIFFLAIFFSFIFFITKHYFSDQNIVFTNKSRSLYLTSLNDNKNNLPLLEKDTNNIIVYKNDLEILKKKKKKRFWEKLISNLNE
tara:strand:- start:3128 stop:3400 length:273 start_codon:yes stop_codon:yes gene_type:complete